MAGRRGIAVIAGLLALTLSAEGQVTDRARNALQAAIKLELVDGNPEAAVEQFKVLAANSRPEIAAEALVHLAACYEKLGQGGEARAAYERVVREHPAQTQFATIARSWLQAHAAGAGGHGRGRSTALTTTQVWTGPGVSYIGGAPSADGRYVAFVDWSSGVGNLALRDLSTGTNRLLTKDATPNAWAAGPLVSPDGRQVFYRWEGGKDTSIRLINTDGTNARFMGRRDHGDFLRQWSPDGRYIAGVRYNYTTDSSIQIILMSGDGSVTALKSTARQEPTIGGFSPDGRFLVYALNNAAGKGELFALATDGSRELPLVQGASNNWSPLWSPDGSRVIFLSDLSGAPALWSLRVVGGEPQGEPEFVRPVEVGVRPIGFARDGALFYRAGTDWMDVYAADFDDATLTMSKPGLVSDQFVGTNTDPAMAPDGKSVAFLRRTRGRGPGAGRSLVIRSLADGAERTVGPWAGFAQILWLPDNRSLLGFESVNGRSIYRAIDVTSGVARTVAEVDGPVWNTAALSPDGRYLYYTSIAAPASGTAGPGASGLRQIRLIKSDLEGGAVREIYRTQSSGLGFFGLTVSADGARLAFFVNVEGLAKRSLTLMSADGGTAKEIYRPATGDLSHAGAMIWTKDGRHLIVTGKCGSGGLQFCAIPTDGGAPRPIGPAMEAASRMISSDGKRIVFGSTSTSPELWVMRNLLPAVSGAR